MPDLPVLPRWHPAVMFLQPHHGVCPQCGCARLAWPVQHLHAPMLNVASTHKASWASQAAYSVVQLVHTTGLSQRRGALCRCSCSSSSSSCDRPNGRTNNAHSWLCEGAAHQPQLASCLFKDSAQRERERCSVAVQHLTLPNYLQIAGNKCNCTR